MLMHTILIRCIGPQTNKKGTKIGAENIKKKGFCGREKGMGECSEWNTIRV